MRELSNKVTALCERLVDGLVARPERQADLIRDFAQPIPVTVIADLLGIPEKDRDKLVPWSSGIIGWFEPERTPAMEREAVRCAQEFMAYLQGLISQRRAEPGDDLFSAMLNVHDTEPERLSERELVNNCILLLNAGHEAVVNVIGNGLYALLSRPDQWAALKADPALVPTAVEEMMRFDTPLQFFERAVLEPLHYPIDNQGFDWPQGHKTLPLLRQRQPRPGGVRGARYFRPSPFSEPAPRVRAGPPLLHRRAAGTARAASRAENVEHAPARFALGRRRARVSSKKRVSLSHSVKRYFLITNQMPSRRIRMPSARLPVSGRTVAPKRPKWSSAAPNTSCATMNKVKATTRPRRGTV